jgi:hypothetical protein
VGQSHLLDFYNESSATCERAQLIWRNTGEVESWPAWHRRVLAKETQRACFSPWVLLAPFATGATSASIRLMANIFFIDFMDIPPWRVMTNDFNYADIFGAMIFLFLEAVFCRGYKCRTTTMRVRK